MGDRDYYEDLFLPSGLTKGNSSHKGSLYSQRVGLRVAKNSGFRFRVKNHFGIYGDTWE